MRTASVGGLVTQASSIGRLHLEDDQAAIIRFRRAGAAYASIQQAMWWYRSIDAHLLQSGLNAMQALPHSDGFITTVISAQDPGIANWIQTNGFRDLLPIIRWQGLACAGDEPVHHIDIVRMADLERHLPGHVERMDRAQREEQLSARRAMWSRRIA